MFGTMTGLEVRRKTLLTKT